MIVFSNKQAIKDNKEYCKNAIYADFLNHKFCKKHYDKLKKAFDNLNDDEKDYVLDLYGVVESESEH